MIRFLAIFLLVCIGLVYSLGQGWIGTRPVDDGRQPQKSIQQLKPEAVSFSKTKP